MCPECIQDEKSGHTCPVVLSISPSVVCVYMECPDTVREALIFLMGDLILVGTNLT